MSRSRTLLQNVTPFQISGLLVDCGRLKNGEVQRFSIGQVRVTDFSATAVLTLTYSSNLADTLPKRLFIKVSELSEGIQALEVDFYQSVGPVFRNGILLNCYGASILEDSEAYRLLLEDISQTHIKDLSLGSSLANIEWSQQEYDPIVTGQIVDGFAKVHSLFWGDRGMQLNRISDDELLMDEDMIRSETAFNTSEVEAFLCILGPRLSSRFHHIFRKVGQVYPDLVVDRIINGNNLTLIHRDPHPGDILVPKDSGKGRTVIVDWATCCRGVGVHDLATHIPPYWHRTVRNAMEMGLLRKYHAKLFELGVSGYSWDQCWYDYRLGVMGWLNRRMKHAPFDSAVGLWILNNCIDAFYDLGCEDLIPA